MSDYLTTVNSLSFYLIVAAVLAFVMTMCINLFTFAYTKYIMISERGC